MKAQWAVLHRFSQMSEGRKTGIRKVQTDSRCAGRRFSNLDSSPRQVVSRVVTGERLKEPQATCTVVLSLNDLYPSLNAATPWNLRTPTWAAGHTPMSPGTEDGVSGQLGGAGATLTWPCTQTDTDGAASANHWLLQWAWLLLGEGL